MSSKIHLSTKYCSTHLKVLPSDALKVVVNRKIYKGHVGYGTIMASHGVTKGCWCFEVLMHKATLPEFLEGLPEEFQPHFRVGWSELLEDYDTPIGVRGISSFITDRGCLSNNEEGKLESNLRTTKITCYLHISKNQESMVAVFYINGEPYKTDSLKIPESTRVHFPLDPEKHFGLLAQVPSFVENYPRHEKERIRYPMFPSVSIYSYYVVRFNFSLTGNCPHCNSEIRRYEDSILHGGNEKWEDLPKCLQGHGINGLSNTVYWEC